MTPAADTYIAYLRARAKVHEMAEKGYDRDFISKTFNIHIRSVNRYLSAAKPILKQLDCNQAWRENASCTAADTELFFPTSLGIRAKKQKNKAIKICQSCPVKAKCFDTALANMECFGIWGGEDFSKYSYEFNAETGEVTAKVRERDGSLKKVS